MIKFGRVEVNAFHQGTHFLGDVFQFNIGAVHTGGQFLGLRKDVADAFQSVHGTAQRLYDTRLIGLHDVVGGIECTFDVLSVRHCIAFLLQFLLFANHQVGTIEFLILELQEIHILTVALYLFFQGLQRVGCLMIGTVCILVSRQFLCIVGNDVEHVQLEVVFVEQQVLVL